jgi:hypothetical protein
MSAAGFQRDKKRRAASRVAVLLRIAERFDLRMWEAGTTMPAAPDGLPTFDEHRAHHRIGGSHAITPPGEAEGIAHKKRIGHRGTLAATPIRLKPKENFSPAKRHVTLQ